MSTQDAALLMLAEGTWFSMMYPELWREIAAMDMTDACDQAIALAKLRRLKAAGGFDRELSDRKKPHVGASTVDMKGGWKSCRDLAIDHVVSYDALRTRLARWRKANPIGWIEVENPKGREAKFLFDEEAVMAVIRSLQPE